MKFAFISRHTPTPEQFVLAEAKGINLVPIGDCDAFSVTPEWVAEKGEFDGVIVVNPAAAMRLCGDFIVGVYENSSRPAEGAGPAFFAKALHIFE